MPEKTNNVVSPKTKLPIQRKNPNNSGTGGSLSPAQTNAAIASPASAHPADLLALQRQYGNQAVQRLIQRKVTVGAADDPLEAEADRMADKVMSASGPTEVHRAPEEEEEVQTKRAHLQRSGEEDELALKRLDIQREGEEDELALKRADLQRAGEEDELALKRADIQRSGEEDELALKRVDVQREGEEDELALKRADVQREGEEDELALKRADILREGEEDELALKRVDVQREGEEDELALKRADVQRVGEEEEVQTKPQRKDWRDSFEAGPGVEDQLRMNEGGGSPLPGDVRGFMETRFGADFGGVRVHADGAAASLNRKLAAQAFTHGSEIYMGEGKYSPDTTDGKRLLAHELTHTLQQGGAQRKALKRQVAVPRLQRYPADTMTSGATVRWEQETATAKRSSSGATGVWFFTSPIGPVRSVVIKPNYWEGEKRRHKMMGTQAVAEAMIKQFGIATPESRSILATDPEAQSIRNAASSKGTAIPQQDTAEVPLAFINIMGKVTGTSVESSSKDAFEGGMIGVNRLLNQLKDPHLLNQVGQLMALDAFMGNKDRVHIGKSNVGNIMYEGQDITAIDSDAYFDKINDRQVGGSGVGAYDWILKDIDKLFSNPGGYADEFLGAVRRYIEFDAEHHARQGEEAQQIVNYFLNYPDFPQWRAQIMLGIQQGIQRIKAMMASKKKRSNLKEVVGSFAGGGASDWDAVRIRQKMIELRADFPDLTERELYAELSEYAHYRQRRARRAKGFKWTARFF